MIGAAPAVRLATILVLALALLAPLSACGKKGPLKPPPGASDEHPRPYPR